MRLSKDIWWLAALLIVSGLFFYAVHEYQLQADAESVIGSSKPSQSSSIPSVAKNDSLAIDANAEAIKIEEVAEDSETIDFEALCTELLQGATPVTDLNKLLSLLRRWIDKDLEAALAFVAKQEPVHLDYLHDLVVQFAAEKDAATTVRWLNDNINDPGVRQNLLVTAYETMAKKNPLTAIAAVSAFSDLNARASAIGIVVTAWAKQDVRAALDWIINQDETGSGDDLLVTVMLGYIEQYPDRAGDLINALDAGHTKNILTENYVRHLAKSDVSRALAWIEELPDEELKQSARLSVYDQWAQSDPWAAVDYASEQAVDDHGNYEFIAQITNHLVIENPDKLATYLDKLPKLSQLLAAENLAKTWMSTNSTEAEKWFNGLAEGDIRDLAIRGIVDVTMRDSPERAFGLAETVSLPERRLAIMRDVMKHWGRVESEAALGKLMNTTVLSTEEKNKIINEFF